MRFSFIFTAALVTIVNAGEEPVLRDDKADSVVRETFNYNDLVISEELKEIASDMPDKSCIEQVWLSESASTDCATKQDTIGGACVWCSGSEWLRQEFANANLNSFIDTPEMKKTIENTGVCATEKQTAILGEVGDGMVCGSKNATPEM